MLVVHASELAASVGMHRYRPVAEVAIQLFARMNPSTYEAAMTRNQLQEKASISSIMEQFSVTDAVTEAVTAAPEVLQTKLEDIFQNKNVASEPTLAAEIQSFVYTERGKNAEEASLDHVETQMKQKIRQRNLKYYKKYIPYDVGDRCLLLGGRVDGITEDGQLVEMKNRQRRLFPTVPVYETIQVHAYMYLTDIKECRLIQTYKDANATTLVEFDEQFWADIVRRLLVLGKRMDELEADPLQQDVLLLKQEFPVDFTFTETPETTTS